MHDKSRSQIWIRITRNLRGSRSGSAQLSIRRTTITQPFAQIAIFSALIALTTGILRIPLPQPIGEITLAPVFYLPISVLFSRKVSFWSIAIGSAIGEAISISSSGYPPIYVPGIVWARAPEALIIYRFRNRSIPWISFAMVLATIYETIAFLIPDTFFYAYSVFSYSGATDLASGFGLALLDLLTLVDLAFVPIAIAIIVLTRRQFHVEFLSCPFFAKSVISHQGQGNGLGRESPSSSF